MRGTAAPSKALAAFSIALRASELCAQPRAPTRLAEHPNTEDEWWVMPNVLVMPALQLCHPMALFIPMKPNNLPLHTFVLRAASLRAGASSK